MPRYHPDRLRLLAGDAAFARGEAYAAAGAVTLLREDAGHLVAVVRGSEDYRVRLRVSMLSPISSKVLAENSPVRLVATPRR
jgi:uncharacterized Zn finger protein